MVIRHAAAHVQHMQKALEQMNVKLTEVLSDITGLSGLRILPAILAGERDPHLPERDTLRNVSRESRALLFNNRLLFLNLQRFRRQSRKEFESRSGCE